MDHQSSGAAPVGPELFFGLVGAVGADLNLLEKILREALAEHTYSCEFVHLVDLLKQLPEYRDLPEQPADVRVERFMDGGNELRRRTDRADAMAVLGVQQIQKFRLRGAMADGKPTPLERQAYVFHSLKRPEEIDTLRRIYGPAFFVIGGYSPRQTRKKALEGKIGSSHHSYPPTSEHAQAAEKLIARDEYEANEKMGQAVRDAFPKADFFVDISLNEAAIRSEIGRFTDILFGYPFHTPTRDENAMFHAHSAAVRSAEMGRQVGAAIATKDGDILALGTNEVPKAGGGLYWPTSDGSDDHRDFQQGGDTSDLVKRMNLAEILTVLKRENLLAPSATEKDFERLLDDCVPLMKHTRVMNSIEFGRAVHAEMDAIVTAARNGTEIDGCTLYTTTFPCHNCTRHIVAAGLRRVVFIEPYAKSLASDLHDDAISVEGENYSTDKVIFVPFVGVAPHRYMHMFQMQRRKQEWKKIEWDKARAQPRVFPPPYGYTEHEDDISGALLNALSNAGFVLDTQEVQ